MGTNYTGDPTAAETPGVAPTIGGLPLVVVPADGDPGAAATFEQGYKALADYNAFTQQYTEFLLGNSYWLYEHFDSSTLNARFALTGTGSLIDDSASGANGAFTLNPHGATSYIKTATNLCNISTDFIVSVRLRIPNAVASGDSAFILLTDTASSHFLSIGYAQGVLSSHWYAQVETGSLHDFGGVPSSSYQNFMMWRQGSTLRFYQAGTLKYSQTYSSTIDIGKLYISISDGGANTAVMNIDHVKVYIKQ